MDTTYNVRIWKIQQRKNKRGAITSYRVRWKAGEAPFTESFKVRAQADSFRADLLSKQRQGIAFDVSSGRPVTAARKRTEMTWLDLVSSYMEARWPDWSPNHRKHTARGLMEATVAILPAKGRPEEDELRKAVLHQLKTSSRTSTVELSPAMESAARWAKRNCPDTTDLADPELLRDVLQLLDLNMTGQRASANTFRLRRRALHGALQYAVEKQLLDSNPLDHVKSKKRKQSVRHVDPRSVVNPMQARMLLEAAGNVGKPGPPLVAFFACMYYAAMRPEEVCSLKKENLSLPEQGWGTIYVERARPEVGDEWSDSGRASEERFLKHRDDGQGRPVPCPPELTALLQNHLNQFATARDGRLFRGARHGGRVGSTTYGRVWAKARASVFTEEVAAGPLGKRPYDLRHAAVSTWLNGGVEPTRVASWAGHSVRVLLEVYAKCLDKGERAARNRIEQALQPW